MILGKKKETYEQTQDRHKKELIELYYGWNREKENATNTEYENYCETQLNLYKILLDNTFNYKVEES